MSSPRTRARVLAILAATGALGASGGALAGASPAAVAEPGSSSGASCPASTSPDAITLVAGTPQTATLNSAYATGLQVALSNGDGCAVTSGAAGAQVTFTAPASGASGVFSASATNTITVGADSSGAVIAPTFTANAIAGSYTVTASSQFGTVTFALTNTAAGTPARLVALSPLKQTATVSGSYRRALVVQVLDGEGRPLAGASVAFTLSASTSPSACGTSSGSAGAGSGADANFSGGASETSTTSNAAGVATSPALSANAEAGTFAASASLPSSASGEAHAGATPGVVAPAVFTLTNLAGVPAKLAPGVGATQSTRVSARFPISLAVTVTDAEGNRVPDALVSFAAPPNGPSARFTVRVPHSRERARTRRARIASVRANACGIAVAPALSADAEPGGYVVKASAGHARAAAFALVNEAR